MPAIVAVSKKSTYLRRVVSMTASAALNGVSLTTYSK